VAAALQRIRGQADASRARLGALHARAAAQRGEDLRAVRELEALVEVQRQLDTRVAAHRDALARAEAAEDWAACEALLAEVDALPKTLEVARARW